MRRVVGIALIVLGSIWILMCFGGIAMMSRTVDVLVETFVPASLGVIGIIAGIWMLRRHRRLSEAKAPSLR